VSTLKSCRKAKASDRLATEKFMTELGKLDCAMELGGLNMRMALCKMVFSAFILVFEMVSFQILLAM
jgi:hypothetical protein